MNKLYESIKEKLEESTQYKCAPSFSEDEGYYSQTNTEAFEMARSVAQYFYDYANFLTNDEEGQRYLDTKMAPDFAKMAQDLNTYLDKIEQNWEQL